MNDVVTLLQELDRDGLKLWLQDGELRFRAPAGVLTDARRAELGARKSQIIEALRARAAENEPPAIPGAQAVWAPTEAQGGSVHYGSDIATMCLAFSTPLDLDADALLA